MKKQRWRFTNPKYTTGRCLSCEGWLVILKADKKKKACCAICAEELDINKGIQN